MSQFYRDQMLSGLTSQKSMLMGNLNSEFEFGNDEKTEKIKNYNIIEIRNSITGFSAEEEPATGNEQVSHFSPDQSTKKQSPSGKIMAHQSNLKMKDLTKEIMSININSKLGTDSSQDIFCLDMGTTPLATERLRVEDIKQEMKIEIMKNGSHSESPTDPEQIMFKKNAQPQSMVLNAISSEETQLMSHGPNSGQMSNEEREIENELAELQMSMEQIVSASTELNMNKKKQKKKKRKKKRNKDKKGWKKPKAMMHWSKDVGLGSKDQLEIEQVFNTNRADFDQSQDSIKEKISNCMCKAF